MGSSQPQRIVAGSLNSPARGGVPRLGLSGGLAGVSAPRLRVRGAGRGCSFHQGGGGGSAVGLIHRPRRETAQPGRRAAVFSLVQPPSPPPPASPRTPRHPGAGRTRRLAGTQRADQGKWEGKQVVAWTPLALVPADGGAGGAGGAETPGLCFSSLGRSADPCLLWALSLVSSFPVLQ